jgi:F-type H+-transporting ATPase subunit epsilon
MATASYTLKVVTPDGEVWSGETTSCVVPGLDGYFGVWKGHAPLISGMEQGTLMIEHPEEHRIQFIAVGGGFVEINADGVTVLAESAEQAGDIDVHRAEEAEARARERLTKFYSQNDMEVDVERAMFALRKAMVRRDAAKKEGEKRTHMF